MQFKSFVYKQIKIRLRYGIVINFKFDMGMENKTFEIFYLNIKIKMNYNNLLNIMSNYLKFIFYFLNLKF